jgi:hypothetical protein
MYVLRAFAVAILFHWTCAAFAASPPDPAALVSSIYAHGAEEKVWSQWLDAHKRAKWFSRRTVALWAKCGAEARRAHDETGPLDFDVATNSQGATIKDFKVSVVSQTEQSAVIVAKLVPDNWERRSERENEIRYDLVFEGGHWAIDDIHSVAEPNPWSLSELLSGYLKH